MIYQGTLSEELRIVELAQELVKTAKENNGVDITFNQALEVIKINKLDNIDTQLDSIQYTIEEKR